MQSVLSFEAKKLHLVEAVMSIDTEDVLDKMTKYLKKAVKHSLPGETLSADTVAMIEQSRKEYEEGKYISFESSSEAQKWLESL